MPRLIIANDCSEQLIGFDAEICKSMAIWSLRLLWSMQEDDIIALPIQPEPGYIEYIADLLGIGRTGCGEVTN